ncbi:MAG: NAD(P)/FAD-dependent oxidoreductase [Actinobacteria bacterium]|nr:NAD(P)/FAD-dependent oxidoreductase [Actinomycetota bacterium]
MNYDAIIIGAGLGGLGAGAALAANGQKVIVLERMDFIGGRCSSVDKDGWRLDIGCHFIFGCEHGSFGDIAKRLGKEIKFYHPSNFQLRVHDSFMKFDGEKFVITGRGPNPVKINVMDAIRDAAQLMPKELMSMGMGMMTQMMPMVEAMAAPIIKQFDKVSMKSLFDTYFDWPVVRDFMEYFQMAGYCTPSNLTASSELLRTVLVYLGDWKPGMNPLELMGYPIGGLEAIPNTVAEGIKEKGGEIRTGTDVKKIIIENGRAVGVELPDGETIKAPVVISNAGIKETVADLVGNDRFPADYARTISDLVYGNSGFTLRAKMKQKISDIELGFCLPVPGIERYLHSLWDDLTIPDEPTPIMVSSPSNMDPGACPEGKQIILGVGPSMLNVKEDFNMLGPLCVESLDLLIPGFKDNLESYDVLTPKTYAAFGEENAPVIGIAQCMGQVGDERPSSKSPIDGLYYVGGEAGKNVSGIACDMAMNSGLACADYIITQELSKV